MEKRTRVCASYLSRSEAMRLADVQYKTICDWIRKGVLEEVVISGRSHVKAVEVLEVMKHRASRAEGHAQKLAKHVKEVQS